MKTQFKLALAVIMVLGSINAMAVTEAAVADQTCSTCDGNMMEEKVEAAAAMNMRVMIEESQGKLDEITRIGDIVGDSLEDSHGLLKFIGEKESFAQMALDEMRRTEKESRSLSGDELFKAHRKVSKLALEVRALNEETQKTLDKVIRIK